MNYSFQREKILETVLSSCDHPNAYMIHKRVQKKIPNISLATVYRNLNFLADHGDILRINYSDGDRFDKTIYPHCHIRCLECNNVFDFNDLDIQKLSFIDNDYEIKSISINMEGICKNCQEKREGKI